jgi:hypothetical protein
MAHEAAFMCEAAPFVGDAAAALPEELGLVEALDVPLGLPEMSIPVLFLQWLS